MLLDSTTNGVAKVWAVEWYSLAWKTWTAEIPYKWRYETWPWYTNASYAWYWPVEDPKFTIVVKLERPRTSQYWGSTSAYIFKDIATYLFDYYEIPKKETE
jgi:cell division protein FtsI/penicillin-binding protein 2